MKNLIGKVALCAMLGTVCNSHAATLEDVEKSFYPYGVYMQHTSIIPTLRFGIIMMGS